MNNQHSVEHLFRHKYGKLVALLSKKFTIQHLEIIEDAVQWSMAQALEFWPKKSPPNNPSAWLYQVAHNYLITELNTDIRKDLLLKKHIAEEETIQLNQTLNNENTLFSNELNDSMLRMLFIACHKKVPVESQLVFTLKSLCGFSIKEISLRLFMSEANIYKRFSRAKKILKEENINLSTLTNANIIERTPSIHKIIYLIFTEGYLSSHDNTAIREDLCTEAIRLIHILIEGKWGKVTESYALLSLMYFHYARISSRENNYGVLVLLEQQDRSKWNEQYIMQGLSFLEQSAMGDHISRYHIEAGIAAEHCLAPSFEKTHWENIVGSYKLLNHVAPSPVHLINQAIATAEWKGAQEGLAVLDTNDVPKWLNSSYYWYAAKADLSYRCNKHTQGKQYAELAINAAPSKHIKHLLIARLVKN